MSSISAPGQYVSSHAAIDSPITLAHASSQTHIVSSPGSAQGCAATAGSSCATTTPANIDNSKTLQRTSRKFLDRTIATTPILHEIQTQDPTITLFEHCGAD